MISRRRLLGSIGTTVAISGCMGNDSEEFRLDSYDIEGRDDGDPLTITGIEKATYGFGIHCEISEATATDIVAVNDSGVIEIAYLDIGQKKKSIYIDEYYIRKNSEFRLILLRKTEDSPWTLGEDLNKGEVLANRTITLNITQISDE